MASAPAADDDCSTIQVARRLGLAVRSVQLMVDRGELRAWKTPGGHRRISRQSVDQWLAGRQAEPAAQTPLAEGPAGRPAALAAPAAPVEPGARVAPPVAPLPSPAAAVAGAQPTASTARADGRRPPRVLLIEDSRHFQRLVALLLQQRFPGVELHLADDGIAGLALAGQLQPDVLLVDLLLPGIDGATLIAGLRTHAAFATMRLVVVTSLQGDELLPYAHALAGLPVVHKPQLVAELPLRLAEALGQASAEAAGASAAALPSAPTAPLTPVASTTPITLASGSVHPAAASPGPV